MFAEQKTDQRWSKRKILKTRSVLAMAGAEPVMARTFDVGGNGMSVALPFPLSSGQRGTIRFDLVSEGKAKPVAAPVQVIYCIFSGGEFKVGLKFVNMDLLALKAIATFVG